MNYLFWKGRVFFILITLFFYNPSYSSAIKVEQQAKPIWVITPKDYGKKIPLKSVQGGFYYKLLDNQIDVDSESDYNHLVLELVSKIGVQEASNISISFLPEFQKLIFHEITIWRDNKPINKLKTSEIKVLPIESEMSSFLYHGTYNANIILDDVRSGDRLEYSYTIKGRNPVFSGKFSQTLFFDDYVPIAHSYKRLLVSGNRNLVFKNSNKVPKFRKTNENQKNVYEWESFLVSPVEIEERVPVWENTYSRVEVSEYHSWEEVVKWGMDLNPILEISSGTLGDKIKELKHIHRGYHKEGFISDAIRLVQDEIRYLGIEIGPYSHKANTPQKVYSQRYGDCKDKSVLLASILKSGGIDAKLALVNSRSGERIEDRLVSPLAFDHMIVYVNHKGRSYFVDPTIPYQRGGLYKLYCPKYGKALILSSGQNKLTNIPQQPVELGKINVEETFFMSPRGDASRLQVRTTYSGNHANDMRYRIAYHGEEALEKEFLEYYNKLYNDVESLDSLIVYDNETDNVLETVENYDIKGVWKAKEEQGQYSFQYEAAMISANFANIASKRKNALALAHPYDINYTAKFHMWAPWTVNKQNIEIKRNSYEYSSKSYSAGNIITLEYAYKTLKNEVSQKEFEEYREDLSKIDKTLAQEIYYWGNGNRGLAYASFIFYFMILVGIIFGLSFFAYKIYIRPSVGLTKQMTFEEESLGWLWGLLVLIVLFSFAHFVLFLENCFSVLTYFKGFSDQRKTFLLTTVNCLKPLLNIMSIVLGILVAAMFFRKRVETKRYVLVWLILNLIGVLFLWFSKEITTEFIKTEFRIMMLFLISILLTSIYGILYSEKLDQVFNVPFPYPVKYKQPPGLKKVE